MSFLEFGNSSNGGDSLFTTLNSVVPSYNKSRYDLLLSPAFDAVIRDYLDQAGRCKFPSEIIHVGEDGAAISSSALYNLAFHWDKFLEGERINPGHLPTDWLIMLVGLKANIEQLIERRRDISTLFHNTGYFGKHRKVKFRYFIEFICNFGQQLNSFLVVPNNRAVPSKRQRSLGENVEGQGYNRELAGSIAKLKKYNRKMDRLLGTLV